MIEYRLQKVGEMLVEGASQYSIATSLGVSQATISKDVEYLEANPRKSCKIIPVIIYNTSFDQIRRGSSTIIPIYIVRLKEKIPSLYQNSKN